MEEKRQLHDNKMGTMPVNKLLFNIDVYKRQHQQIYQERRAFL